jgi:hypothetical protein
MIANCAILSVMLLVIGLVLVLEQLAFLAPFGRQILEQYAWSIGGILLVLFVNVFTLIYLASRRLLLNDTGRKLAHVEKQLRTRDTVVRDLSERLAKEE